MAGEPVPSSSDLNSAALLFLRTLLERLPDFAVAVTLGKIGALVVLLLAFRQRDLDFRPAVLQKNHRWHDRIAAFADSAGDLRDLFLVQQQFARAHRIDVAVHTRLFIRRNMYVQQPEFAAALFHETFLQIDPVRANRLDFRAAQYQTRLKTLFEMIVITRSSVASDHFNT